MSNMCDRVLLRKYLTTFRCYLYSLKRAITDVPLWSDAKAIRNSFRVVTEWQMAAKKSQVEIFSKIHFSRKVCNQNGLHTGSQFAIRKKTFFIVLVLVNNSQTGISSGKSFCIWGFGRPLAKLHLQIWSPLRLTINSSKFRSSQILYPNTGSEVLSKLLF